MSRARAVEDLGVGQRRDAATPGSRRAASPAVARPRPAAAPGPPALVERRRGQDGRLELAVALDREQGPEQRHAADVVVGAVDRVDVPADRRVAGLGAVLLADEPVVRERVEDPLADHPLDRRVGLGHERPVGLGRDLEVAPEMAPGDRVGLVAGGQRDVEPAAQLGVGAAPERRRTSPVPKVASDASLMSGSSRRRGRTAARARPRSRPTRRTPRPRRGSRSRPSGGR